jgi:hypothetical protein
MKISSLPQPLPEQLTSIAFDYLPELGLLLLSYFDQIDTMAFPNFTHHVSSELLAATIKQIKSPLTTVDLSNILVGDEIIAALASSSFAKTLRSLNVAGGLISDDSAMEWLSFELLEELHIDENRCVSSATMKFIAQLPVLSRLYASHLMGCKFSEALEIILSPDALPFLSHLELSKSPFDKISLPDIQNLLFDLMSGRSEEVRARMVFVNVAASWYQLYSICPNLAKRPSMDASTYTTSSGFESWIQDNMQVIQRLESLSLGQLPPDTNLASLLSGLTNLKDLECINFLGRITAFPTNLERLILRGQYDDPPIDHTLIAPLEKLTSLQYYGSAISGAEYMMTILQNLTSYVLPLEGADETASNIALTHPNLTKLVNSYDARPQARVYFTPSYLPSLRSWSTQISSALDFETVSSVNFRTCPQLRELRVEFMMNTRGHAVVVDTLPGLEPHLRSLALMRYRQDIAHIRAILFEIAGDRGKSICSSREGSGGCPCFAPAACELGTGGRC